MLTNIIKDTMKQERFTVRGLAQKAGISPTIVQGLRSGKREKVTLKSFLKVIRALGCSFVIEKGDNRFRINF